VSDRAAANAEAVRRLCAAEPVLVDVRPAGEVVPGFTRESILAADEQDPVSLGLFERLTDVLTVLTQSMVAS